eukprot:2832197-Lingulodinium_polyedra.AAC.1
MLGSARQAEGPQQAARPASQALRAPGVSQAEVRAGPGHSEEAIAGTTAEERGREECGGCLDWHTDTVRPGKEPGMRGAGIETAATRTVRCRGAPEVQRILQVAAE